MRSEMDMHGYQDDAVDWAHANPKSALWIDLGLGKTVICWDLLRRLLLNKEIEKALVVAPVRVATQTWPNERHEWEHLAKMRCVVIRDKNPGVRRQLALSKERVHIINREMLPWLISMYAELGYWPYDCLIIDESSSFKDHTTQRFKALKRVLHNFKRIHELTATPAAQSYLGLFPQMWILDKGQRLGNSVTKFREQYFIHNVYEKSYTPREGAEEQITEKIRDITLVMQAKDHLKLKETHPLTRKIVLDDDQLRAYKKFERSLILKLPSDVEIEALTGAALNQKLVQAASGCVYDDAKTAHDFHPHKVEDLAELEEELDGSPILVGYWFKSSLARLRKQFPKAVVMDKEGRCIDDWNKGKIKMLLAHPQSAGHGLNMQYGPCQDIYIFDMFWSHELYLQFIKRVAGRQGQKFAVRLHHAVAQDTVDEAVMQAHAENGDAQQRLLDRLRRLKKELDRGRG